MPPARKNAKDTHDDHPAVFSAIISAAANHNGATLTGPDPPGTTQLPLARVKRIIKEDKEVSLINAEATFLVAVATELFMEYLVTEGFTRARRDKRKTVYYRDLASVVDEIDQFEFLEDVIPKTMPLKKALERRKEALEEEEQVGGGSAATEHTEHNDHNDDDDDDRDPGEGSSKTAAAAIARAYRGSGGRRDEPEIDELEDEDMGEP